MCKVCKVHQFDAIMAAKIAFKDSAPFLVYVLLKARNSA